MSAKIIWIHVGLVALFAGGVAAGILYHHHVLHSHRDPPAHGRDATHSAEHFRKRLDLTDEQAEKVKGVLEGVHQEMLALTSEFHEKFTTIRSRAWKEIRSALTEKQLPAFEKLVEELERQHSPGHGLQH